MSDLVLQFMVDTVLKGMHDLVLSFMADTVLVDIAVQNVLQGCCLRLSWLTIIC
jgi:hypothetical protein